MIEPVLRSGPWDGQQVAAHLHESVIPLRIATAGTFPLVQSLWFTFDGSTLWCATQADSVVARRVQRESKVGFEIAADQPPYRGVRGSGNATIDPDAGARVLAHLIERYLGPEPTPLGEWLLSRADNEIALRIDDLVVSSWDYSARM